MSICILPPRGAVQDDLLRTRSGMLYVATEDIATAGLLKSTLKQLKMLNAQLTLVTGVRIEDRDLKE